MKRIILIYMIIATQSCVKLVQKIDYPNTPSGNFEAFWNYYDKMYCSFNVKNVNWAAIYSIYRAKVNNAISNDSLFTVLSSMLGELKDGHVNLKASGNKLYYYDFARSKPLNYLGIQNAAGGIELKAAGISVFYGVFPENIGYINIGIWSEDFDVDKILAHLKMTKGIIIDVRNNGGGSDVMADKFVARFTDKIITGSYYRWKNGTGHNDFGEYEPRVVLPAGTFQYIKPTVILTNRRSFSTTEGFVLNMKQLQNVQTIGDTTGGGAGIPIPYFLPNGWELRIPRALNYNIHKQTHEGVGIAPDITIHISSSDSIARYDRIVKKAIEILR